MSRCPPSLLVVMRGVENTDYPVGDSFRGHAVRARATVGSLAEAAQALEGFALKNELQGPSVMPALVYDMESLDVVAHATWNGREARVRMGTFTANSYKRPLVTGEELARCRRR